MSALDDLIRIFSYADSGVLDEMFEHDKNIGACAREVLDKHAHELAEQIRHHQGALNGKEWPDFAADLIDPESDRE